MKKEINNILQKYNLPTLEELAKYGEIRINSDNHLAFQLAIGNSIPISIDLEAGLILSIDHIREPWIEIDNIDNMDTNLFVSIFTDLYVLEMKGKRAAYLHFFDQDNIFKFSIPCVNFPSLMMGKRTFKLYQPIIDELNKTKKLRIPTLNEEDF